MASPVEQNGFRFPIQITKVADQWVLFEELDDPRSKKNRCIKQLIAYRISDFKKMAEPITFKWNCFNNPVIHNGRLIVPFKDHLLWTDLSDIVRFDGKGQKSPGRGYPYDLQSSGGLQSNAETGSGGQGNEHLQAELLPLAANEIRDPGLTDAEHLGRFGLGEFFGLDHFA